MSWTVIICTVLVVVLVAFVLFMLIEMMIDTITGRAQERIDKSTFEQDKRLREMIERFLEDEKC